jgi:hypothetical protein
MEASYESNEVVNRLLVIDHRSLPMYLRDAPPWVGNNGQANEALQVLASIAKDQQRLVDELGEMLIDRNWPIIYGEYPLQFTAYHDLSLDFLLDRVIEHQRRDIARIEQCVAPLEHDPEGKAVAERALGSAKAHLENLLALKTPPSASAS